MGASASVVVDAAAFLTKDEAMALAGADQWDEAQWEAAEKDDQGRVKAELLLAAAAAATAAAEAAASNNEKEKPPVANDDDDAAAAVDAAIEAAKAADKETAATAPARVAERLAKAVQEDANGEALNKAEWLGKVSEEPADGFGTVPGNDNLQDLPEALRADRDFMLAAAAKSARGHALHFASHALKADGDFLRAARQALADKHLALPEEQREQEDYTTLHALNAALANGSTALIRADYLVKLAEEGGVLGHRSQLPAEAIYEGPVWQYMDDDGYHGVVIVALSYMWGGPDHPDPKGEQLRDVAKFLKWLQSTEGSDSYGNCTIAVFWDWASLYQDKPRGSRTAVEEALFKLGLGNVNLWYCHLLTLTLMNKKLPEGRLIGYDGSGWTVRACLLV